MRLEDLRWNELLTVDAEQGKILFGGTRALLVDAEALGLLRRELVDTLGLTGARGILTRFGFAHGQNAAETLRKFYWEDLSHWRRAGGRLHMLQGMVHVEPVPREAGEKSPFADALWKDSYEALEHLKFFGRSSEPVCWTLCGYASGYLTRVNQRTVYCFEEKCVGRGDAICHMVGRFEDELDETQRASLRFFQSACLERELKHVTEELKKTENRLRSRKQALRRVDAKEAVEPMVAQSERMRQLLAQAQRVAMSDNPVALIGPEGVGKERLAQYIHEKSDRALSPHLRLRCSEWQPSLLKDELFGPLGVLHSAAGGSIFLEDFEMLPEDLQRELGRLMAQPVGRPEGMRSARWFLGVSMPISQRDEKGGVSPAFLSSWRGIELQVPSLRDRKEDILPLAKAFLAEVFVKSGQKLKSLTPQACELLLRYAFPGNVRELKQAMQTAVAMSLTEFIEAENLPQAIQKAQPVPWEPAVPATLAEVERQHILSVLRKNQGNRELTAEQLGIGIATLYRKLKAYKSTPED